MINPDYENFKRRVKEASDIVQVVSGYLPLTRKGRNLWACCPFHQEKTPSFTVNPEGFFKCFGCGKGGDVFSFVMAVERLDFPEALALLAERARIPMPERGRSPEEAKLWEAGRALLYRLNDFAARFFQDQLAAEAGAAARNYLARRGLTAESIEKYRLGFAPDSWDALCSELARRKAEPRHMVAAGLAVERKDGEGVYDRFRNRVIFPIQDLSGRTVGFGARALADTDNPKYLNSPETPIFSKGQLLFGLPQAREAVESSRRVLLMEGYTDVIMAAQHGFAASVATLGTALGASHLRLLRRLADKVLLVYDSDAAGLSAAERGLDIFFESELPARIVTLAPGLDPCDFLTARGAEAFAERLDAAIDLFDFKLSAVRAKHDLDSVHGRSAAVKELVDTVERAANPIMAAELRRRAAEAFRLPEQALLEEMARRTRPAPRGAAPAAEAGAQRSVRQKAERELAKALLACPAALPAANGQREFAGLLDAGARELLCAALKVHEDLGELNREALAARLSSPQAGELLADITTTAEAGSIRDPQTAIERVLLDLRKLDLEEELTGLNERIRTAPPEEKRGLTIRVMGLKSQLISLSLGKPAPAATED